MFLSIDNWSGSCLQQSLPSGQNVFVAHSRRDSNIRSSMLTILGLTLKNVPKGTIFDIPFSLKMIH